MKQENGISKGAQALLDEYQRALIDLKTVMMRIDRAALMAERESPAQSPDCYSIQAILAHMVQSGYAYTVYMERFLGGDVIKPESVFRENTADYAADLDAMFAYCVRFFRAHPHLVLEEYDPSKKIPVGWGQQYDVEQLMEHAIVHVLRHRRQIERLLLPAG